MDISEWLIHNFRPALIQINGSVVIKVNDNGADPFA